MTEQESNDSDPFIVELGADTRGAPDSINLDVSGTTGPDHLGQQTTDVDGHWADRPGVRNRLPEHTSTENPDPRIARMDTGESLPVLLESNMSADPIEAVQGTYTVIREGECVRCGYDRLKHAVATLPGERDVECMACGAKQGHRDHERGSRPYSMPTLPTERADSERDSGTIVADLPAFDLVDLEDDTGFGPYVSLVGRKTVTRIDKDDFQRLFWAAYAADSVSIDADQHLDVVDRIAAVTELLPDGFAITNTGYKYECPECGDVGWHPVVERPSAETPHADSLPDVIRGCSACGTEFDQDNADRIE